MLYGHPVQDAIPCHKSSLSRRWHDEKLRVEKEAEKRKEKLEKYYNGCIRNVEQIKVNDPACIQNNCTKRWDRYGRVMECVPFLKIAHIMYIHNLIKNLFDFALVRLK